MTDRALVDRVARTVLYEGYMLYPYRPSSLKNSKRLMFGTLYPEHRASGPDRSYFQAEVLYAGTAPERVTAAARYLLDGVETEVELSPLSTLLAPEIWKLTVVLRNTTQDAEWGSAHAVITAPEGELISMTDPPEQLAQYASQCVNEGVWPVLVGKRGARDTMLASPIILPDYPQVAGESAGDLFDATEIEEILTLRILTLTDEEKAEVRASDERARRILERAESLPPEWMSRLHGKTTQLKVGDRVRLRPSKRADIFDTVLDGRVAIVEAIEQDFENNVHVAVVVEDDPGRDLGEMRQIGHRFFFSPEEIELP